MSPYAYKSLITTLNRVHTLQKDVKKYHRGSFHSGMIRDRTKDLGNVALFNDDSFDSEFQVIFYIPLFRAQLLKVIALSSISRAMKRENTL